MKLLILTCGTGEGHNHAALAMGEILRLNQIDYEIINPITLKNPKISRMIDKSYVGMIRNIPWLFQIIYRMGQFYESSGLPSPVIAYNESCAPALAAYIRKGNFDAVLSVHMFGMQVMTGVHKKGLCDIPAFGISTDYTCIPFFGCAKPDRCFIPHSLLKEEFSNHGLSHASLVATGIPLEPKFTHRVNRAEARSALGIPENSKILLIMSGGEGCGNLEKLCSKIPPAVDAYIFVGKNQKLKSKLDRKFGSVPFIHTVSFTDRVDVYLAAGDALITKAGGLSSTEAAVVGIPIVHFLTYGACENGNVKFFTEHGLSVQAKNADEAIAKAVNLIEHPKEAAQMLCNQQKWTNAYAGEDILAEIRRFCLSAK